MTWNGEPGGWAWFRMAVRCQGCTSVQSIRFRRAGCSPGATTGAGRFCKAGRRSGSCAPCMGARYTAVLTEGIMRLLRERTSRTRVLVTVLAGISLVTATAPLSARADTDLNVGGQAVIAYANGDSVRLRSGPGYDFDIVDNFSEGTTVDVLDGPIAADDGSSWYSVSVNGESGYIVSDWLASSSGLLSSVSGSAWALDTVNVR